MENQSLKPYASESEAAHELADGLALALDWIGSYVKVMEGYSGNDIRDDYQGDASTADLFLQCCLFGEARYC